MKFIRPLTEECPVYIAIRYVCYRKEVPPKQLKKDEQPIRRIVCGAIPVILLKCLKYSPRSPSSPSSSDRKRRVWLREVDFRLE